MIFGFFIGGGVFLKNSLKRALLQYKFGSLDAYSYITLALRNTPN